MNITDNGNIEFEAGIICKGQTAEEVSAVLGTQNSKNNFNNGWCFISYKRLKSNDDILNISFRFKNEKLKHIDFIPLLNTNKENWNEWSENNEVERRKIYDTWLNEKVGVKRNFNWGKIEAVHDPRSGGSGIIMIYK